MIQFIYLIGERTTICSHVSYNWEQHELCTILTKMNFEESRAAAAAISCAVEFGHYDV